MILLLIALAVILLGIVLYRIDPTGYDYFAVTIIGVLLVAAGIIATVVLSISLIFVPYNYGMVVAQRNAIEVSLQSSRQSQDPLERATILREVAQFNIDVEQSKIRNKYYLLDPYVDDRIDSLQLIK